MGPRVLLPITAAVVVLVAASLYLPVLIVATIATSGAAGAVAALMVTWRMLPAPAQRVVAGLVRARVGRG